MSQLARLHHEFEDITGLSRHLNEALLVTKRVAGHVEPCPEPAKQKDASGVITDVLRSLLEATEGDPKRPWLGEVLEDLTKEIGRSEAETRSELKACLARVAEGLNQVDSNDVRLLDHVGTVLDQSSATLYRRIIRA